jgi:hypothetical protein
MKAPKYRAPSKTLVGTAASCVVVCWFLIVLLWLAFLSVIVAAVFRWLPWSFHIGRTGMHAIFGLFGLFLSCGVAWIAIALILHCPHCNHKFRKNPKGRGPAGFVYYANCRRKPGFNPWAVQIVRFHLSRKILCVKCGEEVFR